MAAGGAAGVEIHGLRDLLRDLRRLGDREAPKEIRRALVSAAGPIVADARRRAPRSDADRSRRTYKRHLADTIRAGVRGSSVVIRSPAPHAQIVHWGGRRPLDTHNREQWITVRGRPFITDAAEAASDRLVDDIGDAFEKAARAAGWK